MHATDSGPPRRRPAHRNARRYIESHIETHIPVLVRKAYLRISPAKYVYLLLLRSHLF